MDASGVRRYIAPGRRRRARSRPWPAFEAPSATKVATASSSRGRDLGADVVSAFGHQRHLGIGGIDARQDVARRERLQHRPQRVVQRQHVVGAAAGGQRQHRLVLQRGLRQQVQEDLEHAAVGRLVDRRGHHDGPRSAPPGRWPPRWSGARCRPATATAATRSRMCSRSMVAPRSSSRWLTESSSAAERERSDGLPAISRTDMEFPDLLCVTAFLFANVHGSADPHPARMDRGSGVHRT